MNSASVPDSRNTPNILDVPRKFFLTTAILSLIFLGIAGFLFSQKITFLSRSETVIGQSYGKTFKGIDDANSCHYDSELAGYFADLSSFSLENPEPETADCARYVVFTTHSGQTVEEWAGDYTYVAKRRNVEVLYNRDDPNEFIPNEFKFVWAWVAYTGGLSAFFGMLAICCLVRVKAVQNIGHVFERILGVH